MREKSRVPARTASWAWPLIESSSSNASVQVSFTFEIPYIKRYQPEGLTYYYTVWQDEKRGRQRMERGTAEKRALETVIQITDEVRAGPSAEIIRLHATRWRRKAGLHRGDRK